MATPTTLQRSDLGQILIPAGPGHRARTDAVAFGPNLTIRAGQAVAQKTTDKLMYAYSSSTLTAPAAPTVTPSPAGGTLAAATYYYKVAAQYGSGNSAAGAEASATTTGTTSSVALTIPLLTGATAYSVYRGTAAGAETFLATVPPPQMGVIAAGAPSVVTYTDTGTATTAVTPPAASAAATDGTQTCLGVSEYSFVTDASGMAYMGTVASPSELVTPDSTMPYFYCGNFDPRDLVGFDAAAAAQMNARALASGILVIP